MDDGKTSIEKKSDEELDKVSGGMIEIVNDQTGITEISG